MANSGDATDIVTDGTREEQSDWMTSIAKQFGSFDREGRGPPPLMSSGDRAIIRRIPVNRERVAEGTVIKLLVAAGIPRDHQIDDYDRWRMIAHVAATLSGTGKLRAHAPHRQLGTLLHEAGYSENRLLRLLAARGEALHDQVHRATHIIAQKGKQPVDLWAVYHLIGDDPRQAEAARLRIAHDYYAAEARSEKGVSSDD